MPAGDGAARGRKEISGRVNPLRDRQTQPILIERVDIRLEIAEHWIPGRWRLDIVQRAAFRTVIFAEHLPG